MPSRKIQQGDPVLIRGVALEVASDAVQVMVDDGAIWTITQWFPAGECARPEDVGELKPIRRANPRHLER